MAKAAGDGSRFIERLMMVGTAAIRNQESWDGMPGVALQVAGRAMVTGDDEDRWFEGGDLG